MDQETYSALHELRDELMESVRTVGNFVSDVDTALKLLTQQVTRIVEAYDGTKGRPPIETRLELFDERLGRLEAGLAALTATIAEQNKAQAASRRKVVWDLVKLLLAAGVGAAVTALTK